MVCPFLYLNCRAWGFVPAICDPNLYHYCTRLSTARNANKTNSGVTEAQMLDELGLFSQQSDVNNEIQQIHSRTLLEQTMKDLQTNVSYWAQGDIRFSEVYNKSSFQIELLDLKKTLTIRWPGI